MFVQVLNCLFFFSSRRRHTRCALVTGVQTCALPIYNRIITIKPRPDGAIRRVQKSVQGIVTDSTGVPLTGVTVMIKGESTGTSTELDGSYVLPAESDAVLVFSLLGFTTREEIGRAHV